MSTHTAEQAKTVDIGRVLDEGAFTGFQKLVVCLAALSIVMDGFDGQLIGFAIPSLIKEWGITRNAFAPELLTHETESALLGALQEFPRIVAMAAELREPHRVARYIEEIAGLYHKWYDNCRVIPLGDEPVTDLHRTRLWLNDATGQVIRNGLGLVGVSAPERM